MAFPGSHEYVSLTGTYTNEDGSDAEGNVTFRASSGLTDTVDGTYLAVSNITVPLSGGTFTIQLLATDDPDVTPTGWSYSVTEFVNGVTNSYYIQLKYADGASQDLADIEQGTTPTAPTYYLEQANNLSDVASVTTARTNLGLGTGATANIDTTGTDIRALGTQSAGSSGKLADAEHVHPTTGLVTTADINTTASTITYPGTQAAGSTGKVADAGHVHPPSVAWYNVKAYGAAANGTTNDTTAVQDALTAIADAKGGTLYLPGLCLVTISELTYTSDYPLSIVGDAAQLDGSGGGGFISTGGSGSTGGTVLAVSNCGQFVMRDIGIYADDGFTGTDTATYTALSLTSATATLERVKINVVNSKNPYNCGVYASSGDKTVISDCNFTVTTYGAWFSGGQLMTVSDSIISTTSGSGYGAIYMYGDAQTLRIRNSQTQGGDRGIYAVADGSDVPAFIFIDDFEINNPTVAGVQLNAGSQIWANKLWITGSGLTSSDTSTGLWVYGSSGFTGTGYFTNCTFQDMPEFGCLIESGTGYIFTGCSFGGNGYYASDSYDDLNIATGSLEWLTINGCHFDVDPYLTFGSPAVRTAIWIGSGITNYTITNCQFAASGYGNTAVYDNSAMSNNAYSGNINAPNTTSTNIVQISGDHTLGAQDSTVLVNAAADLTITIPAVSDMTGRIFTLIRMDSEDYTVTIATSSTQEINGATSITLSGQWTALTLQTDGTDWYATNPSSGSGSDDLTTSSTAGGDASGTFSDLVVTKTDGTAFGTGATANIDSTATDIKALGTQAAGSSGKLADAEHVHPTTGLVTTADAMAISGSATDGYVLTATGSSTATWQAASSSSGGLSEGDNGTTDWINVKDSTYGAKGDGSTDDTTAIQDALNAASSGQTVFLPAGTYKTSSPLTVPPCVTFLGETRTYWWPSEGGTSDGVLAPSSKIMPDSSFSSTLTNAAVVQMVDESTGSYSAASGNQTIVNITIDGSNLSSDNTVSGIQTYGSVMGVTIKDCSVASVGGNGFVTNYHSGTGEGYGLADQVDVSGLVCWNVGGDGTSIGGCADSTFTRCHMIACSGYGWYVWQCGNTRFSDCKAEWSGTGWYVGTNSGDSDTARYVFTNCNTDNNTGDGWYITGTQTGGYVLLSNCDAHADGHGAGTYSGFHISGASFPVIMTGCGCYVGETTTSGTYGPVYGIKVDSTPKYVQVTGGIFQGSTDGWEWDSTGTVAVNTAVINGGTDVSPETITAETAS